MLLLAAPGLGSGGSEVPLLVERHVGATVLRGEDATVEAAMAGLDGASLAHVAAHGHFRPDSPLFSSLEMADGSLSVYELERLKRAPYRLVLSACESGVLAPSVPTSCWAWPRRCSRWGPPASCAASRRSTTTRPQR